MSAEGAAPPWNHDARRALGSVQRPDPGWVGIPTTPRLTAGLGVGATPCESAVHARVFQIPRQPIELRREVT